MEVCGKDEIDEKIQEFWDGFGSCKKMVLSTSWMAHVTSRMMSVVVIDGCLYFQTDRNFRKYEQLRKNTRVALCVDNIQIEGNCLELGRPLAVPAFSELYARCFRSSYDRYTALKDERVLKVIPEYIQRWAYDTSGPYLERFECTCRRYSRAAYNKTE